MSALRIQCFELSRVDRPRYGDSIEGATLSGDAAGGNLRLAVGASRRRLKLAHQLRTHERFFHGVRNGRSGSANRESTVTSKGGLDSGDPKVVSSQG